MTNVAYLTLMLQTLVTTTANQRCRETGFIQRQGKVTDVLFV